MTADESERRLAEALRAQARGGGRPVLPPRPASAVEPGPSLPVLLVMWLLAGALLGCVLALLSLLVPGALPAFG